MKVFWSWQSDTRGKIGRHFVRDAIREAIELLKQPSDIEEPVERDVREALHLDHDREGVSGNPDLAPTIFDKINQATVFVADVTLVGEVTRDSKGSDATRAKRLINSNVAIEYGYALGKLSDRAILMVQNRHYGDREKLPFDLKHKAGPIQFALAPDATAAQINAERACLRGHLVTALRPYLKVSATISVFMETPATSSPAIFFDPSEVLARIDPHGVDKIEYRFNEARVFYLRLIPTAPRSAPLKITELVHIVEQRRLDVLTRTLHAGFPDRNRFGGIAYEPHGTATTPRSLSQIFQNGEIWGVTTNLCLTCKDAVIVPTGNVENLFRRVLTNYCAIAGDELGVSPPYQLELGAVGLQGVRLGVGVNHLSGPIHTGQLKMRRVLHDPKPDSIARIIDEFLDQLFDLAGEIRQ